MNILHIDSTFVPIWLKEVNGRKSLRWVTPEESERLWFEAQMLALYGKDWYDEED